MSEKWYIGVDIGGTKTAVLLISENAKVKDRKEIHQLAYHIICEYLDTD